MHRLTAILLIATGLLLSTAAQGRDANRPAAIVRTQTAITIDGDLAEWESIEAQHAIHTPEGDPAATFKLAYDAEYLYAAFYVIDDSPMRNSSATLQELIKGGDAIGICLGAGGVNQRIITAQVDGRPVIMAYRPTWPQKRPHTFSSPVSDLPMDYVGPIDGARAAFGRREGGYTAELALPWRGLGIRGDFTGTIPFDVQIIFSDPAGTTNVESAWWHATGGGAFTTEDLPTEAALYPDTWGQARLHERDPGPRIIRTDTAAEVGTPITFELPRDARVSMLIVDIDGWIVRELVRAERMRKGTHTVYWDGRDRYDEPLPPGVYTWRLAYFDGMGTKFHGSVGNSARPPFRTVDGKGSKGGQHGGPSVLGVDKGGVYIMGGGEEGHPAMRKIDLDGYTLWKRSMGGFGRGIAVAVDDDYVYIVQASRNDMHLTRLNPNSGAEVALPGNARVRIGDNRLRVAGLAIAGDKAYFSVPSENRIGVVNLADGTLGRDIAIEMPQGVARLDVRRLLVCSGTEIKEVNLATGAARTAITGLSAPRAIATDAQGRIYVSDLGDSQQIKIFNANRLTRTIGKAGGRAATVLEYDPNELQNVVGLGVDAEGHVWAVEQSPIRRVARFSATGEHKLDLYGPVAYNVFGPDLDDFSRVYYQTSQGSPVFARTRLDYDAYSADPVRGGTDAWQIEAVFRLTQEADTEAGEVDLMTSPMSPGYGHVVAFTATNGHRYLWRFAKSNRASNPAGAAIWRWTTNGWVPAAFVSNRSNAKSWSDTNGDGRVQPEELYDAPPTNHFAWLDRDLVLYGWHGTVAPSRIDERGVPFYDGGEYKTYLDEGQPSVPGGGCLTPCQMKKARFTMWATSALIAMPQVRGTEPARTRS